MISLFSQMMMK